MRSYHLLLPFFLVIFLFAACGNPDVPQNYAASGLIGENIRSNSFGIPEAFGDHEVIYVYPDKTYIRVGYTRLSEEEWSADVKAKTRIQAWTELADVMRGPVLMNEGDIATLTVEQFIQYMEDTYF